jgi:hypothetical protein
LTEAELDGLAFGFYGEPHASFFVSPVGGILLSDVEPWQDGPGDFMVEPVDPAIAVLWDYFGDYDQSAGSQLFWQVDGAPGDRRLIVQWNDLVRWGDESTITFQAVLHESDGAIDFNYLDVEGDFEDPYYFQSAIQGIKGPGEQDLTGNLLLLGVSGLNQFSQSGVSVRIAQSSAPSPEATQSEVPVKEPRRAAAGVSSRGTSIEGKGTGPSKLNAGLRTYDRSRLDGRAVDALAAADTADGSLLRARRHRLIGVRAQGVDATFDVM